MYAVEGGVRWAGAPGVLFKDVAAIKRYKKSHQRRAESKPAKVKGVRPANDGRYNFKPTRPDMRRFDRSDMRRFKPKKSTFRFKFEAAANKCSKKYYKWLAGPPTKPFVPPLDVA